MNSTWLERFGNGVGGKTGRWITLLVWIVLVGLVNATLPQASSEKNDAAANLANDMPSVQAQQLADREFPSGSGVPALLTWYRSTGLTDQDLAGIQTLSKQLADRPLLEQISVVPLYQMPLPAIKAQLSKDGTALVLPVLFAKEATADQLKESLDELKKTTGQTFPDQPFDTKLKDTGKLLVRVTGPVGIQVDATALFGGADVSLLLATVVLVLLFLLGIYRSPILALIPLVAVGFAYGLVNPLLGWMAKEGWIAFDSQGLSIMTVLLFGAGTDYCLFLVARFRSTLTEEENKAKALLRAIGGSAGAIAMSGLTVMLSLLALLLAQYGSIERFAVPFSLSILLMMAASLTLVPALLAILGRVSFFPFVPRTQRMLEERAARKGKPLPAPRTKPGFGMRLGDMVVTRPKRIVLITAVILGALALCATQIRYTFDTLSSFPSDMPSREGFTLIGDHFDAGGLAPVQIIVRSDGKPLPLKDRLAALPYLAKVSDPIKGKTDPNMLSYTAEFNTNPYANEAMDRIPELRAAAEQVLAEAGISDPKAGVWIGGQTADQYDTRQTTNGDAMRIIPTIIVMIAVLLLLYLRSVAAMLFLMATVLLSYFSALGLGWLLLHYAFGADAIQGLIPLYAFVFLVALGEDYNIFMVSSIWQKSRTLPLSQSVKEGVARTGSVITSAGLILAGTFAVLATLPIQVLVQFGTVTALGVLLDTFIVRPFLVPAITVWLGNRSFWPAKRVEPAESQAAAATAASSTLH